MTDPISLGASEHQLQRRHAIVASTIATAIEWYDFLLYSTVTGLVFAKSFTGRHRCNGASLGYRLASVRCRGSGAADRHMVIQDLPIHHRDHSLYRVVCRHHVRRNRRDERPCRRGYFGRISNAEIARADVICAALAAPI